MPKNSVFWKRTIISDTLTLNWNVSKTKKSDSYLREWIQMHKKIILTR